MHDKAKGLFVLFALGLACGPAIAAFSPTEKARVTAQPSDRGFAPGEAASIDILVEVEPGWHVNSHQPTYDYLIPTEATVSLPEGWAPGRIEYPTGKLETFAFADEPLSVYDGQFVIQARSEVPSDWTQARVDVPISVRYQACDDRSCLPPVTAATSARVPILLSGATDSAARSLEPTAAAGRSRGLVVFLLFGVVGGLLLNAMPCVLPVLSLKLLGLVKSSGKSRRAVSVGSLVTAAGILVSFWALAAAAILAKTAGASVGWGIQFQQPTFVAALTFVVALFCLNLWGLFEVPLPQRIAGWADAGGGEGLPSHFTAGLFATLLATPCSAPFLGTAVGFALGQTAGVIMATFTAVGVGMALPYFVLAAAPGTVKLLPKPGAWMEHFRFFMGFLLAAAAVWLLYVLSSQVSRERLAAIELALLALALFVWVRHRAIVTADGRAPWRVIGGVGALAAIVLGLAFAAQATSPVASRKTAAVERLIPWVKFDREEALELAASGRLVFVDVTADWCFTCKVNERLVLETRTVAEAFDTFDVVPMKADWTNRDDRIAEFLAEHGRYGIPFYLLYRPGREPHLFSEVLTREAVVGALSEAASAALEARVER